MKITLPIILTVVYTVALWFGGTFSKKTGIEVSNNTYVNGQVNYQIILLVITGVSLLTTYLVNKENFLAYFSFGQISIPGDELKIFGIKQGDSWLKTGLSLCLVITGVTAIFMYFQLKKVDVDWSILQNGIFWILLFSLTNSFGEEMIYRLGLVSPLQGLLTPTTVFLISALIFGLAHINGMPSGIIGISLAGILGFVLAKSVFETQGFFWAWIIHFLQDVVIIGSLYLMNKPT
ncbi:MAG: CPBP family intramembrane metalloprotease [Lewinellaceae bacterium]|nr:CPBP family intramembrane metalloprotease [Flavobacteriaceae bacterium]MCB0561716.1 CPBP family intramembrane metalloprotease [Phaeodactylibacter sp.]MCB9346684.1 CPBP family intramembrane metalloprotease [Lewinellaceae bacterium]